MIIAFIITVLFGVLLYLFFDSGYIVVLVLGMRGGVGLAFNGVFLITLDLFPIRYKGTIFGCMGLLANVVSIFGPLIAEKA